MLNKNGNHRRFGQDRRYLELIRRVYGFRRVGEEAFSFSLCGNRLVSVPFFEFGGIADGIGRKELRAKCEELLEKTGAKYLEIHGGIMDRDLFTEQPLYQTAIKKLPRDTELLWESISYEAKKTIKQSEKFGVICHDASVREVETVFYPVYCKWMKSFGSPVHPLAYFKQLKKVFGDECRLVIAQKDNRVLACLLGVICGDIINLLSSPATDEAKKYRANDATHWYLMKAMVDRGLAWFDFGPVRYSGQRRYKIKWGVELQPYSYWYYLRNGEPVPKHLDPDSLNFLILRWCWKKLLPSSIANIIGPQVRKLLVV